MEVASAAAATLTILLPIRIVISRCSGESFSAATAFEPGFPSFTSVLALARVIEMRATSELEKKAERRMQMTKSRISTDSWIIAFHAVLVHADYSGS
jgi:hypothetical protein